MDHYIELNAGRCGGVVHTGGRWIIAQSLMQVDVEVWFIQV